MSYEFSCKQLFNEFGAPGIPNSYRAALYQDGKRVLYRDFWWYRKAERQCERWAQIYGAVPRGDA